MKSSNEGKRPNKRRPKKLRPKKLKPNPRRESQQNHSTASKKKKIIKKGPQNSPTPVKGKPKKKRAADSAQNQHPDKIPTFVTTVAVTSQFDDVLKGDYLSGFGLSRIALVGRSNVGKSSLLNKILGRPLAQTSKKPGKTRSIHFYRWPTHKLILVDLPGYGFAAIAKSERERWNELITTYIDRDPRLKGVLILLDSRHGPTDKDLEAIQYFGEIGVPMGFIMTKADLLSSKQKVERRKKEVLGKIRNLGLKTIPLWVSIEDKNSINALINALEKWKD